MVRIRPIRCMSSTLVTINYIFHWPILVQGFLEFVKYSHSHWIYGANTPWHPGLIISVTTYCRTAATCEQNLLRWRHNDHDSVSNHQPHDCLLNRLFRRRSKKTSKLRATGLCVGNSPGIPRKNGQLRGKCYHKIYALMRISRKKWLRRAFCVASWLNWHELWYAIKNND